MSPELDALVAQCLERDRGKRIHSAAELVRRLEPHIGVNSATPLGSHSEVLKLAVMNSDTAPPAVAAASETQRLNPTDPIASPAPPWRIELQEALAKNRQQSSPVLGTAPAVDPSHDATIPGSEAPGHAIASRGDQTSATVSTAATVRPALLAEAPAITPGEANDQPPVRRRHAWVYASVAAGAAGALALLWLFRPQTPPPANVDGGAKSEQQAEQLAAPAANTAAPAAETAAPVLASSPLPTTVPSPAPTVSSTAMPAAGEGLAPPLSRPSPPKATPTPASPARRKPSEPDRVFGAPLNLDNPYGPAKRK